MTKRKDFTETDEFKKGLYDEKFYHEVNKECGPIIERIAAKYYPDLSPEELGQKLLHDNKVGVIFTGYVMENTDWDEIWNEFEKENGLGNDKASD